MSVGKQPRKNSLSFSSVIFNSNCTHFYQIIFYSLLLSCSKLRVYNQTQRVLKCSLRTMSSSGGYLVDDPKYSFLRDNLKLERTNPGVYNGKWFGSGNIVKSIGTQFVIYFSKCEKKIVFSIASKSKTTTNKFHIE